MTARCVHCQATIPEGTTRCTDCGSEYHPSYFTFVKKYAHELAELNAGRPASFDIADVFTPRHEDK